MTETDRVKPLMSVIVATRDRPDDIQRSLPSILANDYDNFEVIIVDQSSTTATEQLVGSLSDNRIRYIKDPGRGKSRAVNIGMRCANGTFLALTDDDCSVPPEWLRHGSEVLTREPRVALVSGSIIPAEVDWSKAYAVILDHKEYRQFKGLKGRWRHPSRVGGGNMMVSAAIFRQLGGFDEALGPGAPFRGIEDGDLDYRALCAGYAVVQDPGSSVLHWGVKEYASGAARRTMQEYLFSVGATSSNTFAAGTWLRCVASSASWRKSSGWLRSIW
jgi:glycosyltransferase involved in cell wall biosynthesis